MNLIHFIGDGDNRKAYVQMLSWANPYNSYPPMAVLNFTAVDEKGQTWFVPSAAIIQSRQVENYLSLHSKTFYIISLEAHGAVRRRIQE